jgi:hypothetical protein
MEYFDVLKSIIDKKQVPPEDISKHYAGVPAIKWLSANPMACYEANKINSCRGNKYVPAEAEYMYLKNAIKLKKNTYIPFDKKSEQNEVLIAAVAHYYKCSPEIAKEYLRILKKDEFIKISSRLTRGGNDTSVVLNTRVGNKSNVNITKKELQIAVSNYIKDFSA